MHFRRRLSCTRTFRRPASLGVAGAEEEGEGCAGGAGAGAGGAEGVLVRRVRRWEGVEVAAVVVVEEADGGEVRFGGEDAETGADEVGSTELLRLVSSLRRSRASGGRRVSG